MAWTTPRTWAAGEVLTAALMNAHVRDNFNAIISDGLPSLVVARGSDASMPTSDSPLRVSGTYTGTAAETAALAQITFTDARTTQNLRNDAFRIDYVRDSGATQTPSGTYDSIMTITPSFNQSLATTLASFTINGASIAATKTAADLRGIVIGDAAGSGAVTTQYGLFVNSLTKGSANYAIYTNTGDLRFGGNIGFFGTTPTTKKTVSGSRGGNAALASLLTQLAAYGLITDSSS